jgi:AraC-like DNA-binding protein
MGLRIDQVCTALMMHARSTPACHAGIADTIVPFMSARLHKIMDNLSAVLNRFSISAGVFYSGNLCGIAAFGDPSSRAGHLHLLKSGTLKLVQENGAIEILNEPTLIFLPRSERHRLMATESDQADIVCASIEYGTGTNNPLANTLPSIVILPLAELGKLHTTVLWLFEEAHDGANGRHAMMDRLCELLVIQLLRFVTDRGLVRTGMLAGMAHPQLAKCITAMHANPERSWQLEELADMAGMSRSVFAATFRDIVGQPPGDYLIAWRVGVAQGLLKKGRAVNLVANDVGYENASALGKVFRKKVGLSPMEWLRTIQNA